MDFGDEDSNVFTVTPAGKDRTKATHGSDNDFEPEWSPDRKWIVFTRNKTGTQQVHLYKVHPDGSGLKQIPHTSGAESPSWSRDGKLIAYDEHNSKHEAVVTIRPDGSHKEQVTPDKYHALAPTWAPDGKRIAFEKGDGISSIKPSGKGLQKLTGNGRQPDWAPDGKHIAFVRGAKRGADRVDDALFVMRPDGTQVQQLTLRGKLGSCTQQNPDGCIEENHFPSWAPDGKHIAYEETTSEVNLIATIAYPGGRPPSDKQFAAEGFQPAW